MTDLAVDIPTTDSTVLNPDAVTTPGSGGGAPNLRDTVADAVAKASEAADKADTAAKEEEPADAADKGDDKTKGAEASEKPAKGKGAEDAKEVPKAPERAADGKFQGKEKAEDVPAAAAPKTEESDTGKRHIEAPAKFLPDAKETWRNTPRAVQRDVENAFREHEAEVTKYREAAERYEPIREFDELVRQNGRAGVHETLAEVKQLEDLMGTNPVAAVNHILQRAGPRKPDGSPVSLREFVQAVAQMDQQTYNRAVQPPQAQQQPQNDNTEVSQLRAEMAQLRAEQVAASVIAPFKATHPRYDELQGDIAFFLKSDKVPDSLSPHERLEAAYDMAVRINPASHDPEPARAQADPASDRRADEPSAATSIKTAPGAVTQVEEPRRAGTARDEVERVIRRMTQSGR